jgi:predicted PurR-regulated permease PerM
MVIAPFELCMVRLPPQGSAMWQTYAREIVARRTCTAMAPSPQRPAFRFDSTLTLAVLAILIIGCFLVVQPFLTAIVWAAVLCATLWPLFVHLRRWLRGRSGLAALALVLLITLTMLAPFVIVGITIAENADLVLEAIRSAIEDGPPEPPAWLTGLPLVGENVAATWSAFAHDTTKLLDLARQYIEPVRKVLLASGTTVLGGILQLALSIFIAFFFFRDGDAIIDRVHAAIDRIAGERGHRLAVIASVTVRGVVIGILGTALAQGVLMAIGLWMTGVKAAPLLGLVTFFLSPVPIGPPLVWIPVGLYLLNQGATGWGIFLLLWGLLVVSSVDNFLKPMLISRGSDLPFVLVLIGVLGGAVAFGFIGVFLGPVLIAVGYALLKEWAAATPRRAEAETNEITPGDAGTV